MTHVGTSLDALQLCAGIDVASDNGAAAAELHAFAYLACLLSVYDSRRPDDWGYQFHATPAGAPFAPALDDAITSLRAAGLLIPAGDALQLSDEGVADLHELQQHDLLAPRLPYLDAATTTAVLMPLPTVTGALAREPQLERALGTPKARNLLDDAGLQLIVAQYEVIAAAFVDGQVTNPDLSLTASLWLMALLGDDED